jgi:hypothetical protein
VKPIQNPKSKIQNRMTHSNESVKPHLEGVYSLACKKKDQQHLLRKICLVLLGCAIASPQQAFLQAVAQPPINYATLFASRSSPGSVAVGAAEGNLTTLGQPTAEYNGHIDPGNRAINKGFCSWNQAYGISVTQADQLCLTALQRQYTSTALKMRSLGLNPKKHYFAIIMATDLWNQSNSAGPQFPFKYFQALKKGFKGEQALIWARVEAFRNDSGQLDADGLFGICSRYPYYSQQLATMQYGSQQWNWNCIKLDQARRVKIIKQVFQRFWVRRAQQALNKPTKKVVTRDRNIKLSRIPPRAGMYFSDFVNWSEKR